MDQRIIPLIGIAAVMLGSCDSDEPKGNEDNSSKTEAPAGYVPVSVLEYSPAPGQFVNELPLYRDGYGIEDMRKAASEAIDKGEIVSLGGAGGYIVYRLDKYITNRPGRDFRIIGNAFHTKTVDGTVYGSSEPGIVYVMEDSNGNGLPDETWYELYGSQSTQRTKATLKYTQETLGNNSYRISVLVDGAPYESWLSAPQFHPHSYFPLWVSEASLSFEAVLLPANAIQMADGQYMQECYTGYADSQPNSSAESGLDISAVRDSEGRAVELKRVDFVKVVTGVLQFNGQLGECSTEVGQIEAL